MITLREINRDNFWDCIELNVGIGQQNFVTSNAISIAQSKVQPECIPLAIYHHDIMVGFLMYCLDVEDQEYWIYRFMIDEHYQGQGFGTVALNQLVQLIQEDTLHHQIFVGVHYNSDIAIQLYENAGFKFNGQIFGHEHIMVLNY